MEDKEELEEASKDESTPKVEGIGKSRLQTWNLNIKKKFQVVSGGCLIDSAYKCKSDLTLSKSEYDAALAKHYLLTQLLRFFGWLSALDIARKDKEGKMTKDPDGLNPIDLKREAACMLYRSSQRSWGVKRSQKL